MEIELRPTSEADLPDLMALWNDGAVMAFVGYPSGLGATAEHMTAWLRRLEADPSRRHYVLHGAGLGFCGEAFAAVYAAHDLAALDIKLRPDAQGRGIALRALALVIEEIFAQRLASRAYVDPSRHNGRALRLYERLGFVEAARPSSLEPPAADATHLEVTPETFRRP